MRSRFVNKKTNLKLIFNRQSILVLEPLNPLVQLLDLDNEMSHRVQQPIEQQSRRDQQRVALTLHDGFLMTQVLRRSARVALTGGARLVLPVDVHQ